MTKTALVEIKVVDAGGSDSPSCVDECMETFAWGEVEIEEIVDRSTQVARAAIRDGDGVIAGFSKHARNRASDLARADDGDVFHGCQFTRTSWTTKFVQPPVSAHPQQGRGAFNP